MFKSKRILLLTTVTSLGLVMFAAAGQAERGWRHGRGMHGFGPGMIEKFDSNDDNKLTQSEIDEVRRQRLQKYDQDGDGRLTLKEYEVLWMDAMRKRMVDRFQRLDEDGDAIVTTEEFVQPFSHMVDRLDRDEDGELKRAELRRHHRRGERRGEHRRRHRD